MLLKDSNTGYACEEHVDILIDELVESTSFPPDMEKLDPSDQYRCGWCGKVAIYRLWVPLEKAEDKVGDSYEN